jgi:hypothetical protein
MLLSVLSLAHRYVFLLSHCQILPGVSCTLTHAACGTGLYDTSHEGKAVKGVGCGFTPGFSLNAGYMIPAFGL